MNFVIEMVQINSMTCKLLLGIYLWDIITKYLFTVYTPQELNEKK